MKKFLLVFLLVFLFVLTALSVFAKDIPLKVTETEWGFEISNLDAKGKRICKGFLNFQEQENVYIIFKTNTGSFLVEVMANEIVYKSLPYISVLNGSEFIMAQKDKKTQMYGPLLNYDSVLVISSTGKIKECSAYSDGKFMQLKVSTVGNDSETQFAKLVKDLVAEKERIEAEKRAEEERLAKERELEEKRLARENKIKELMAGKPNFSKNDTYIYSLISEGVNNGSIAIEAYIGGSYGDSFDKIVLPTKLEGLPVKEVRGMNFSSSTFKTVVIPASVNDIGDEAFKDCGIENLIFDKGVVLNRIGKEAFANNKIKVCTLPRFNKNHEYEYKPLWYGTVYEWDPDRTYGKIVKKQNGGEICQGAFKDNQIQSLIFEKGDILNLNSISDDAFANNKLTALTVPAKLRRIGDRAFMGNQIQSLTFEKRDKDLLTLGEESFAYNKIKTCSLPFFVVLIRNNAFRDNGMEELCISGLQPNGSYSGITGVSDENMESWEEHSLVYEPIIICPDAFSQNKIKKLRIRQFWTAKYYVDEYKESARAICGGFLEGSEFLEEIFFEYGVSYIPPFAFANCSNLKRISLPTNYIHIRKDRENWTQPFVICNGAFSNCTSLSEIVFRGKNTFSTERYYDYVIGLHLDSKNAKSDGSFYGCPLPLQTKSQLLNSGLPGTAFEEVTRSDEF